MLNTHPYVMWELVKDHQTTLRREAEDWHRWSRAERVTESARAPARHRRG